MPAPFPPIAQVLTRGASASHAGPELDDDAQRVAYIEEEGSTFVFVVQGIGAQRSGRAVADHIAETCLRALGDRRRLLLESLAETWWSAEHGESASRARVLASLPPDDRIDLAERIDKLLTERTPDAIGDQAVLEAEASRVLELPSRVFHAAHEEVAFAREQRGFFRNEGASAMCALFAAGKIAIAHIGDCRLFRLRDGTLESLTRPHTLRNAYLDAMSETLGPEQIEQLPRVVVRQLGGDGDDRMTTIDVVTAELERGDVYLFLTRGLADSFDEDTFRAALLERGTEAALHLVERGSEAFEGHTGANVAAVAVEVHAVG